MASCSVEGCSGNVKARGLCRHHYYERWSRGDFASDKQQQSHRQNVMAALKVGCARDCSGLHNCWRSFLSEKIAKAKSLKGLKAFVAEDGRAA